MSKTKREIGLCLVLAICLVAAWVVAGSTQPLPDRRPLMGRVTGADGQPLKGAVITLRRQSQNTVAAFWGNATVTDERGNFSYPDAEDGSYYLTVEATGFAPVLNRTCVLNESTGPLEIKLAKLGVVRLRVLQPDGSPLAGANVSIRLSELEKVRQTTNRTRTDKNGVVTLPQIVPARYVLFLVAPARGYAILHEVNVLSGDSSELLEARLKPGGVLRVTTRESTPELGEVPQNSASGDGKDEVQSGRPLGGATLALSLRELEAMPPSAGGRANLAGNVTILSLYDTDRTRTITRDGDGTVEISNLAPGRYQVSLFLKGYTSSPSQMVVIEEAVTASLDFVMKPNAPAAALEVAVQNAGGEPVPDTDFLVSLHLLSDYAADVASTPQTEEPDSVATPLESLMRRARSNAGGRFVLYPVRPGKWRVTLSPYPSSGGRSMVGSRPTSSREVIVTEQNNAVTIRLREPQPVKAKTTF
jgi:hypothetical protein